MGISRDRPGLDRAELFDPGKWAGDWEITFSKIGKSMKQKTCICDRISKVHLLQYGVRCLKRNLACY